MKRNKERSFKHRLFTVVLCVAIPLAALLVFSAVYSTRVFNGKLADSNQRTVDACIVQIEKSLSLVDETLAGVAAGSGDFTSLSGGLRPLPAYLSALNLYNQLKTMMPACPAVGGFFLYSMPSGVERDIFTSDFDYGEKQKLRAFVREAVRRDSITTKMGWRWAKIDGRVHLFRFFGGRSTYIAAMVPLERVLDTTDWKLEQEAVAAFSTLDGEPLTQREFIRERKISLQGDYTRYFFSGAPDKYMVLGGEIENTDCRLVFLVGGTGYLDSLDPIQAALLVLSLLAVLAIPLLLIWVNHSIIAPVEEIKGTMERIQKGEWEARAPTQGKVLEFQQMNETFNTMMEQIQKLKIAAYEKEIETQKAELRYLQLQIRPHFFLNCLKNLYALAQQQEYGKIQRMILAFSRHIRYIFRDNLEFVPLGRELEHVRNYIEIQGLSAAQPPVCAIDADPRLLELPIPPLSVQTFVENSIKHGTNPDHPLEIDVTAAVLESGGEIYADLTVSDNGSGFSEKVLQEINAPQGQVYAQHHVGLNNIKKRMNLIYGDNVMFAFFNSERGSVSEILIPLKEKDLYAKGNGRGDEG